MSTNSTPIHDWRQNVHVEISVKPLPPISRFRAKMMMISARLRNRRRIIA